MKQLLRELGYISAFIAALIFFAPLYILYELKDIADKKFVKKRIEI